MLLGQLLKSVRKEYQSIRVRGISFDSRKIKRGDIFFAIKGNKTSGIKFINKAISKGATAIISNKINNTKKYNIPIIVFKDVRKTLSEACSNFYKKKPNKIIAVTGTNGKSSVVNFFYQILNLNKIPAASIGTLGIFSKNYSKKTNLTSIDPLLLHKSLKILKEKKSNKVILEASSHGLEQRRLDNLNINVGIFTNFSHDHLDYHKNMKSYFNSKMYLFKNLLKKKSTIITDEDIGEFSIIKKIANKRGIKKITIGTKSGNIKILSNKYKQNKQIVKISFNSKIFDLEIPLIGYFQVKNLLMAILAASRCGLKFNKIISKIHKIKPVEGRLECVSNFNNNSSIIVDFAHTPDALEQSLLALKKQFKKEIIIVFGCGGERDKKKRFAMGKIASKYCRKIFVTDDNPRNENPKKIRQTIIKGCSKPAVNIGSRKKAIKIAIRQLKSNEVLLISGKGHEETQDYGNKIINFSDRKFIKKIINKNKIYKKKVNRQNFILKKAFDNNKLKTINYSGVSINTKSIKKNNLFFAIRGKKTDGHKFVKEAIRNGATKSVVSKNIKGLPSKKIIKVDNTFSELNSLAKFTRENSTAKIIGITGSVGKTTLKNLVSFSLMKYGKVHQSPLSYNNKYGVPLSICNLKTNTDYGVFEIGMDKKGEIDILSKLVKPQIGVITNISSAHFKNFNTIKDIAKAKAEIIKNIEKNGHIVLNKEDYFFKFLSSEAKKRRIKVTSFSLKKKSNVYLITIKKNKNKFVLKTSIKNKIYYFSTKNIANNFLVNVLACLAVLSILNLNLNKLKKIFNSFRLPEGRGDIKIVKKFSKKFKFIDESYNANPLSMASAIQNINDHSTKNKKYIFLGDMMELGTKSKKFHRDLSKIINRSNIDKVFVYGNFIKETFNLLSINKKGKAFKNLDDAHNHFKKILHNNDLLMVKGSNATGLNKFSKNIKKG